MSGETLRDRLVEAKISGAKTGQGYEFRTNENAAIVAVAVFADWLRTKAAQTLSTARQLSSAGEIEAVAVAKMLTALAASPTPAESTEEAQP